VVAAVAIPVGFDGFDGSGGAGVYAYAAGAAKAFLFIELHTMVGFDVDGFYWAKRNAGAAAEAFIAVHFDEFGDCYVDASFAEGFSYFFFHFVGDFDEDFAAFVVYMC
jgi:hypothetical protein